MSTTTSIDLKKDSSQFIQDHVKKHNLVNYDGRHISVSIFCRNLIEDWVDFAREEEAKDNE